MHNLYLTQPNLCSVTTTVEKAAEIGGLISICPTVNLFRAAGGGEPADRGRVEVKGRSSAVVNVAKSDGRTWLILDQNAGQSLPGLQEGSEIDLLVDALYRDRKRRLHSLTHIVIAAAFKQDRMINVLSAEIDESACCAEVTFETSVLPIADMQWQQGLHIEVAAAVESNRNICTQQVRSPEVAAEQFGKIFRVSSRHALRGKVRVVVIDGYDANPCSGIHADRSGQIAPFHLRFARREAGRLRVDLRLV